MAAHVGNLSLATMWRAETHNRGRWRVGLALIALGLGQPAGHSLAQPEAQPRLTLSLPAELHAGEHMLLTLEVWLPEHAGEPLLVTPFREGQSIEIVKGRLLRSDARNPRQNPLRFELPMVARSAGAAVVGVKLLAYLCRERCRALEIEARRNVVVLPR
jgi:hypothetical protein